MKRFRQTEAGFTLIELLVVIAIIAILIALLLPSLSSARYTAKNVLDLSNMRSIVQGFTVYSADNNQYWPYRPDGTRFNKFQKGKPTNPCAFENHDDCGSWSLVNQIGPYMGANADPNHGPQVMDDGTTLGPTFVCTLYEPYVPPGDHRAKYGTHENGLADVNFGGNENSFMSYNLFVAGGSWREVKENVNRTDELIDFGKAWPPGTFQYELKDSQLMLSCLVWHNPSDPSKATRTVHRPFDNGINYNKQENHNGWLEDYFETFGQFNQNAAYMDGAARTTVGNHANLTDTHAALSGENRVIPLDR
ncbi:MAG: prepilin-type N-terminal cleavage/methylation domain-containing protein [Phycisphaeraceae bacterium]|nr:prepilin-type N-terminal cleavage/methylation domain-containing protein [Phycisphaeraceae bacterium]